MVERINSTIKGILIGTLAVLIVSVLILTWVPPISRDALVHHLAVPKLYLSYGSIYELPLLPFSYYPMNLDLLYLVPLYLGNDIIPKLIHFSFALLTAWLIFHYLRRRLNAIYGLLGVIFFLSIPIVVKLSITVYVDLGVIFFSTASLLLLLRWIESGFQLRFLILSAGLCGLAMGTKYSGLVAFFLLTVFVPFLYSRYSQNKGGGFIKPMGYGLLFFAVALLVFSPWMVRNYCWKGNPIYPLYNRWFNPKVPTPKEISSGETKKNEGTGSFLYRSTIYNETWWQIALLPVRVFVEGKDGSGQYFDGKLNPFLLILPIFSFFRIKKDRDNVRYEKKIMLTFAGLFFAFAFFGSVLRIRYISPIIPPLIILSVFGTKFVFDEVRRSSLTVIRQLGVFFAVMVVVLALGLNAGYIVEQFRYVDPLSYIGGELTRDEYISRYRPEFPVMKYVNKNLPSDARCLFIFLGKRGYYFDREYIPDTPYQTGKIYEIVKESDKPHEILASLNKMGVTYLVIHIGLFQRWATDLYSNEKQVLLNNFFRNHVSLLYEKNGFGVFRLIGSS